MWNNNEEKTNKQVEQKLYSSFISNNIKTYKTSVTWPLKALMS